MSLERIRQEMADTKRELGQDVQNAEKIAESKKRTMDGLERITSIPDEEDRSALDNAKESVRADAKSDFEGKVDSALSDHASRAEGIQGEAQDSQRQVDENASVAQSVSGSSDYGKSGISSFEGLMAQRSQEYGSAIEESKRDVEEARRRAEERRRELDS